MLEVAESAPLVLDFLRGEDLRVLSFGFDLNACCRKTSQIPLPRKHRVPGLYLMSLSMSRGTPSFISLLESSDCCLGNRVS